MTPRDRLADAARAQAPATIELLEQLVAQRSVGDGPEIAACLELVVAAVAGLGGRVDWFEHDGLPSAVVRLGGGSPARCVALSGHVDVVSAGGRWSADPFVPARRDGALYGRGTCDMKGGVAAFAGALRALAAAELLDACAVELVLTGDEEVGSRRGIIPLLEAGAVRASSSPSTTARPPPARSRGSWRPAST